MAKQTCGSREGSVCGSKTEAMQKTKIILNSPAAVIHKNKRNAAGNGKTVVHPCFSKIDLRTCSGLVEPARTIGHNKGRTKSIHCKHTRNVQYKVKKHLRKRIVVGSASHSQNIA